MDIKKLIIIGSGPAGYTAGIYASRAELKPLVIEGNKPGGQLMGTSYIENWPGEKKILGTQLMHNMKEQALQFGCEFRATEIKKVDFKSRPFKLWNKREELFQAECVIIATGAEPNKLNCKGEQEYWGKGVTTCAVCDGAFYKNKKAIIIGGGDTAMEDAHFMTKFTNDITVVQILDKLTASKAMQSKVVNNPNIKIIYNSTVQEIKGDQQKVTSLILKNNKDETTELEADVIFVAIGLKPQTEFLKDEIELDNYGYVKIHENTKTSVEGVFACGDVADYKYRQAITSSASGCMAAIDAEKFLSKKS